MKVILKITSNLIICAAHHFGVDNHLPVLFFTRPTTEECSCNRHLRTDWRESWYQLTQSTGLNECMWDIGILKIRSKCDGCTRFVNLGKPFACMMEGATIPTISSQCALWAQSIAWSRTCVLGRDSTVIYFLNGPGGRRRQRLRGCIRGKI
jgi:hypothetical protein